jgi:hypothetical protein
MLINPLVLSMMTIAALTACIETTDGAGVVTPANMSPRSLTSGPASIRFVNSTGDLTLAGIDIAKPFTTDLLNRSNGASASASVFSSLSGRSLTVIAEENPGNSAGTYALVSGRVTTSSSGAAYGRFGTSTLPSSGTASYSGEYAGIAFENYNTPSQAAYVLTTGDVSVQATFTSNRVDGKIINRQVFGTDGSADPSWSAANIQMNSTTLTSDGDYQATLSGGGLRSAGNTTTTNNGRVNGIIGEINGQSTAGILFLNHSLTGSNGDFALTERGAFSASR